MLNREKFNILFGGYSPDVQRLIMNQLDDPENECVFGLSRIEAKALRDYLGVDVKLNCEVVVRDPRLIPPMAKVSRKLMSGVIGQTYLLEIERAKDELSRVMDINDLEKIQIVSEHTTGELMGMYGLAAYPLLQVASENKIYPLPDLSPNGSIRPFIGIENANFSVRLSNALNRVSRLCRNNRIRNYGNVSNILAQDDDELLKIRNVGKVCLSEVDNLRERVEAGYPEHYRRLKELREYAKTSEYYESGSRDEFNEFKKECELRKLINYDDEECLDMIEDYTESQLRCIFGELYDILEMKCQRLGFYPLPEFDSNGDVVRKYKISSVPCLSCYDFFHSSDEIQYVHQLFELDDNEMHDWLGRIRESYRNIAVGFVEDIRQSYPKHIEVLKDARAKRDNQNVKK